MTKDQFMRILVRLQQMQQMTVGSKVEFKIDVYRRSDDDDAALDYTTHYKEQYLRSGTILEKDDFSTSSAKVNDFMAYLRNNKWI